MNRLPRMMALLCVCTLLAPGCSNEDSSSPADTQAPLVSITSPKADQSIGRQRVTVIADASDNVGVTRIEFYLDGAATPAATVTTPPWRATVSIDALADGPHTLQAKARDAAGNEGTSTMVTFRRGDPDDTTPPSVVITTPATNEAVGMSAMAVKVSATDDAGVMRIDLYIDGGATPAATFATEPWETVLDINAIAEGAHTLTARAVDAAGNAAVSVPVAFRKENLRMTLIEMLGSANCLPCAGSNAYFAANTKDPSIGARLAVIKYHVWWPRTTDQIWIDSRQWSRPRTEYLYNEVDQQYWSAPRAWVGGVMQPTGYSTWIDAIGQDRQLPAEVKIALERTVAQGASTVTIRVTGVASSGYSDLRLHTIATESEIQYSDGNGETEHHDAMRIMLPDGDGEPITLSDGETKTFTRVLPVNPGWRREHMQAVVFVQSLSTKKILQAARIGLY